MAQPLAAATQAAIVAAMIHFFTMILLERSAGYRLSTYRHANSLAQVARIEVY
jgi:hypothetical protein